MKNYTSQKRKKKLLACMMINLEIMFIIQWYEVIYEKLASCTSPFIDDKGGEDRMMYNA